MNTVISKAAFGMIYKDQDRLLDMLQEMSNLGKGFDVADVFPSYKFLHVVTGMEGKLKKLHHDLDETLNSIIADHNKTGSNDEDFLDFLLRCQESSDLEFPNSNHVGQYQSSDTGCVRSRNGYFCGNGGMGDV